MENCDEMRLSASNFGFDMNWVADVLEKFGQDVLSLAIEAARHGLSATLVIEMIDKLGKGVVEFIVDILNNKSMVGMANPMEGEIVNGPVLEGVDSSVLNVIIEKWLPLIINNYLPLILEKYGPQLIQALLDLFLKSVKK